MSTELTCTNESCPSHRQGQGGCTCDDFREQPGEARMAAALPRFIRNYRRTMLYGRRVERQKGIGQNRGGEYTEGWNALMSVLTRPGSDV